MSLKDALDEQGLTLAEFCVGTLFLCGIAAGVIWAAVAIRADFLESAAARKSSTPYALTIEHDGHRFVKARGYGFMLHHPDCPCQKPEK
jgi:hypothetical protein